MNDTGFELERRISAALQATADAVAADVGATCAADASAAEALGAGAHVYELVAPRSAGRRRSQVPVVALALTACALIGLVLTAVLLGSVGQSGAVRPGGGGEPGSTCSVPVGASPETGGGVWHDVWSGGCASSASPSYPSVSSSVSPSTSPSGAESNAGPSQPIGASGS